MCSSTTLKVKIPRGIPCSMESTTFSLPGKILTALRYLGPKGEPGLDGKIHEDESTRRTAATLARVVGMRGNNVDKPLRELEKGTYVERIAQHQGRGCRWRITTLGSRVAAGLWDADLPSEVLVGSVPVSVSGMVRLMHEKLDYRETPEGRIRFVVDHGWLPYLHGAKQNSQRVRDDYDPFGYLLVARNLDPWEAAIEVTAAAAAVVLTHRRSERLGDAASIVFSLLRSRAHQTAMLISLVAQMADMGVRQKTIESLLECVGGNDVPDKNVRVASFEVLFRLQRSRSGKIVSS